MNQRVLPATLSVRLTLARSLILAGEQSDEAAAASKLAVEKLKDLVALHGALDVLQDAVKLGNLKRVREVCEAKGPKLLQQFPPEEGARLLLRSLELGLQDIAVVLLRNGADPNSRQLGNSKYPLLLASQQGMVNVVIEMLKCGVNTMPSIDEGFGDFP